MVNAAAKLLSRSVSEKVMKGMDIIVGTVTLPHMRHPIEWGEAVEGLSDAVVNNRIHGDCADVRRASEYLARRILRTLLVEMKEEKQRRKLSNSSCEEKQDFYNPDAVASP
ncbi:unnamed protein product [Leptosia nina]|uniref:Uncharacterized protein n=1 Tax=Leptosia nina TaxID=320188 RepID=A0AAV1IVA7_9NEOP